MLIVAAAAEGPGTDGAHVDVDELAEGVVADAAGLQAQGHVAKLAGRGAGDANVDGFGEGVLGVFGDSGVSAAGAKEVIAPRGAIAADNIHDSVGLA